MSVLDNFDSYNDGALNGQGGWSGTTNAYSIQGTVGVDSWYFNPKLTITTHV